MTSHRHFNSASARRSVLLTALLLAALPLVATAQQASAVSSSSKTTMDSSSISGMDHGSMDHSLHGMAMPATPTRSAKPVVTKPKKKVAVKPASPTKTMSGMSGMNHAAMPGMHHPSVPASSGDTRSMDQGAMSGMDHSLMSDTTPAATPAARHGESESMQGMDHGAAPGAASMTGMTMGPMQGGRAPPDARSPDYSDGLNYGPMEHMTMHGAAPFGMLLIDQLEAFNGNSGSGQTWEAQAWYGNDVNKLWVRTEGDRRRGKIEDGDVEVFWNRNVATFWSTQLGVRHELGDGPARNWAAFGIQGLAPYWFELEATGYVGPAGRTAARLRADYELLFTQRLILQPEFEVNLSGKSDPARRIGRGVSDAQLGLRLRYEIRRQFAPYVGVVWTRRFGATADFARDDHHAIFDRQWVAGVRIWF
ncbi:copper resistance protein B [Rhodanobacter sp. AS-Z3]|uniref:copper resistance protein B n=1 Tax=Rhodanobacter sp. AS-Z3 TaxID=3031330 RepID=UPI00247AD8DB|nr:copper resistance protein B [Rhodanobacter sp. AS-Z3]WEN15768.1 copper resistance protein B [Rhodanobacter sp. AS-Z3]